MQENYVTLKVNDGSEMQAYVSRPKGNIRGGVIVFQEAFGVNGYIKRVADRIAAEGYLAVAPELFTALLQGSQSRMHPLRKSCRLYKP